MSDMCICTGSPPPRRRSPSYEPRNRRSPSYEPRRRCACPRPYQVPGIYAACAAVLLGLLAPELAHVLRALYFLQGLPTIFLAPLKSACMCCAAQQTLRALVDVLVQVMRPFTHMHAPM